MILRWCGDRRFAFMLATFLGIVPNAARAQLVRGTVYDQARPRPAIGAIVTLERIRAPFASPEQVRSVLTDESGAYSVRPTEVGVHRITVRRIGSKPFRSEPF